MRIMGVDPGNTGAIVILEGRLIFDMIPMPMTVGGPYDKPSVDMARISIMMKQYQPNYVLCELPASFGMGSMSAFTYGYNFARLSLALGQDTIYIRPGSWTKCMHADQPKDLKPKAKSQRVFDKLWGMNLIKDFTKAQQSGIIDAALIALYANTLNLSDYSSAEQWQPDPRGT